MSNPKITRFPPEPNGFLHIGHCKSIFINWESPNNCHLRLDDTNPSAEKQEFVDNIIEDLVWLGFNPGVITYTSDYFSKLYDYAILLIKNNYAYVDFSNKETIKYERNNGIENEYRSKSIEWNLQEFNKMFLGEYHENECVLRLKIDMKNNNHTLRDPIAYRINFSPHYRTKTTWKIYPSYDFSHGIIDALENITHSYCTDEFYVRREQYYWPVNKLIELGEPLKPATVHEYGKLSIENSILSKRNINKLVNEGNVSGYSDPRLLTIKGLRRRGFTPTMIKQIVEKSSLERRETIVNSDFIDHVLRTELEKNSIRIFGVVNPLTVNVLEPELFTPISEQPILPNHHETHKLKLSNKIYIERDDFQMEHDKNYYRYTPENIVRLRYNDFTKIHCITDNSITIKRVIPENPKKVKGIIHWVSEEDAIEVIYELFTDLASNGEFNPDSKKTMMGYISKYVFELEYKDKVFQLERVGYFKLDRYDEINGKKIPVFIRIVGLFDRKKI